MRGLTVASPGAPYVLTDNLQRPTPSPSQILVKSLVTAINPVDTFMQSWGLLVTKWPIVLGCDASGVVVEVGVEVKDFKVGDNIFGCTRLGIEFHGTFQEFVCTRRVIAR
jgi:NADPH:quinone reductase-like Zn-dependent oxidoreductase